jgi:hypothetical protein
MRYFRAGFKTDVAQVRCDRAGKEYTLTIRVEGPPATDPFYRDTVRSDFKERFMKPGFGNGAWLRTFDVVILAGDAENGKPPEQMLMMPTIKLPTDIH